MCNCGNNRQDLAAGRSLRLGNNHPLPSKNKMWEDVSFEYTGMSALSVTGNITGKHYRFTQPGNVQLVDYRDASGMMAIPVLRR